VLGMKLGSPGCPRPLLSRAINADFRLGDAGILARYAGGRHEVPEMRAEAIRALGEWEKPPGRDRITGVWRPIEARDPTPAREALQSIFEEVLQGAPLLVKVQAV